LKDSSTFFVMHQQITLFYSQYKSYVAEIIQRLNTIEANSVFNWQFTMD